MNEFRLCVLCISAVSPVFVNEPAPESEYPLIMIHFACDRCHRPLETDDDLAGAQAACPHCGTVNTVPQKVAIPAGVPVARAAPESAAEVRTMRMHAAERATFGPNPATLARLGLPAMTEDEQIIRTVHPVLFRARPDLAIILLIGLVGGLGGAAVMLFMGPALLPFALGAAAIGVASLLWWIVWKVKSWGVTLVLTNKRAIERRGLLSRTSVEAVYDRIQDIELTQTFWQRMTNTGTLGLDTSAEDGTEIEVADIPDPKGLRAIIDAYRGI